MGLVGVAKDITNKKDPILCGLLEDLFRKYHRPSFFSSDPIEFPHNYKNCEDREAVALLSALLAYGNVKQIRKSISTLLERIGEPASFVHSLSSNRGYRQGRKVLSGFIHRFNRGEDVLLLLRLLSETWEKYGSLNRHFERLVGENDVDIGGALTRLIEEWSRSAIAIGIESPSFNYFLTSPAKGSACKRWCMFLRWMIRKDEIDLGLCNSRVLRPKMLIIPLDTHTARISRYFGLTSRKSADWRMALEVTNALKSFDIEDPTKYDFAISRLGILDLCQKRFRVEICKRCELLPGCLYARKRIGK